MVAAVLAELGQIAGLRVAEPGEFTRRALAAGRIDLTEAEGLADLLEAETEQQRQVALASATGGYSPVGDVRGYAPALARPLPLDYASAGVAGSLLGYWTGRRWQKHRELEEEEESDAEEVQKLPKV